MKTPHIHAALIKAWADGATIEVAIPKNYASDCTLRFDAWMETKKPEWNPQKQYRVRPEPKPDVILYAMIAKEKNPLDNGVRIGSVRANQELLSTDTCMFVFDGETGALKDVQLLAKE